MRPILLSLLMILYAASASAQSYPQPQPATQPQQLSDNYSPAIAAYNQPRYAQPQYTPPQPQAQPAHTQQAQPGDYGQSVTTDIRQMNF